MSTPIIHKLLHTFTLKKIKKKGNIITHKSLPALQLSGQSGNQKSVIASSTAAQTTQKLPVIAVPLIFFSKHRKRKKEKQAVSSANAGLLLPIGMCMIS